MIFAIRRAGVATAKTKIELIDDGANALRRFFYKKYRCILNDCSV